MVLDNFLTLFYSVQTTFWTIVVTQMHMSTNKACNDSQEIQGMTMLKIIREYNSKHSQLWKMLTYFTQEVTAHAHYIHNTTTSQLNYNIEDCTLYYSNIQEHLLQFTKTERESVLSLHTLPLLAHCNIEFVLPKCPVLFDYVASFYMKHCVWNGVWPIIEMWNSLKILWSREL